MAGDGEQPFPYGYRSPADASAQQPQQPQAGAPYGPPHPGQPGYGQAPYGHAPYGRPGFGQQAPYGQQPYGQQAPGTPGHHWYGTHTPLWWGAPHGYTQQQDPHRKRRTIAAVVAGVAIFGLAFGTGAVAFSTHGSGSSTTSSPGQFTSPWSSGQSNGGSSSDGSGIGGSNGAAGSNGIGGSGGTADSAPGTGKATAAQSVGVVDIDTVLDYGSARAAGTGIVLTSNGEILTNNHVVHGSTSVKVTVVSTGKTYSAKVVGTDPTDDVAVLQLNNASGLKTANIGNSSSVAVGNTVTGVGNAGGTGGTPSAATGTVTALDQSITASDEGGGNSEQLTGMIETNANIQAGDSGGPLYSSSNKVIGMDTAASASSSQTFNTSVTSQGYAIPINKALTIAKRIVSGESSTTIHQGYPAFLGVELGQSGGLGFGNTGAVISGVVDGSAVANAGLQAGDTVTSLGNTSISSASDLTSAMANYKPGQSVSIGWTDSSGQSHTATVTLGSGPAD